MPSARPGSCSLLRGATGWIALVLVSALASSACGCGDSSGAGEDGDEQEAPVPPKFVDPSPATLTPARLLARKADNYMAKYGHWDADDVALARAHDVVILDPNASSVDRDLIATIQEGDHGTPVIVLCYLSIGEDQRTAGRTDSEMAGDPRFTRSGTGPRIDPRGPFADGESLTGIDPLGLPSSGGSGWASFYLDDVSVRNDPDNVGDGIPDRNANFGAYFVNAGDPDWFEVVQHMTIDGPDGLAGLREILTTDVGRGFGCDGVFMDTLDTAGPNSWTDASSSNETKYEWTAPGFSDFVHRLRTAYPDAVILQNRALFFFNPETPHFAFNPRSDLDFLFFESYRLNSNSANNPHPYHYPDNRFNFTPKLTAEANRSDGFQVLSLGYAEGPADQMDEATLIGESTLGYESLLEDIRVAERLAGFRHYLTNSSLSLVNRFVLDNADRFDDEPPVWTSTYNDNDASFPDAPTAPTPRVGIQRVEPGAGSITVHWDVALDLNPVHYALYYQTQPFDFAADPNLSGATRVPLVHEQGQGYRDGVGPGIYAHQATITNLSAGQTYYLVIRAYDEAEDRNEDTNQVVLSAQPSGSVEELGRWSASNGVSELNYRVQHSGDWIWKRVYIDRDRLTGTGLQRPDIGADFMIEGASLYRYAGTGTNWMWTFVRRIDRSTAIEDGLTFVEWSLAQADIGEGYRHTRLVFEVETFGGRETSVPYDHIYTSSDPNSPYLGEYAENDNEYVYYHVEDGPDLPYRHIYIDTDDNSSTGLAIGGIGAEFLIENGRLYEQVGSGWHWRYIARANMERTGNSYDWQVSRADIDSALGAPVHRLVFQANSSSSSVMAPVYVHHFSR